MNALIATAFPTARSALYKACELIIARGPQTIEQLMVAVDFGAHGTQKAKVRAAIQADWMRETPAGTIDVTESIRAHFAEIAPKQKFVGQVAPPAYRGNVFGKQLDRKHIPSSRGQRADIPPWSVKSDGRGIKSVGEA